MGQTQGESCCPEGDEVGIVLKCGARGVGTWLVGLDLSHGDKIRGWHGSWRRLLEECRRQIIGKILLDELRELRCFDGCDQSCCIGGSQHKETAKPEQLVLDDRAANGAAEFVSSKRGDCAAPN